MADVSGQAGMWHLLFRGCVGIYPKRFRDEEGPEMRATFARRLQDVGARPLRRTYLGARECLGAIRGGLALRFAGAERRRKGVGYGSTLLDPVRGIHPHDFLPDRGRDLRHAGRALLRRPGVTANAVLAFGLGIGLATVMFCATYAALYRPLPVPDGNRILHVEHADPDRGLQELDVAYHDYVDWRAQQTTFEDLGAFYTGTVSLSGGDRPERLFGAFITPNTFDILRVGPLLGRAFITGEDRPQASAVALISHAVWRNRYEGRADVVGRQIRVNGEPATIVGVMPEGFGFPYWQDVWLPLKVDAVRLERGAGPGLEVFGRLKDGETLEAASSELRGVSQRLAREHPESNAGLEAVVEGYTASYRGEAVGANALFMLLTALAVLLIASSNVANLLLAQVVTRTRDMAVRVAMGASRRRIVGEFLLEAAILAAVGALLGTAVAFVGVEAINRAIAAAATYPPPFWIIFKVDAPILLFVAGITGFVALAAGMVPALKASGTDVHALLQDSSRVSSSLRIGRLSRALVLSELTVAVMLLVISGHLAKEVLQIRGAEYGYPLDEVLTARVGLFDGVVPSRADRLDFYQELMDRLGNRPEVVGAALATTLPGLPASRTAVRLEGITVGEGAELPSARLALVSAGFFEAMDVAVVQGREFTSSDVDASLQVAVVNRSFVDRYLSEGDAVGRQIAMGEDGPWRTVVGVVPDLGMDGAFEPEGDPYGVYIPIGQSDARFMSIAVRARGEPSTLAPVIRSQVFALQGDTPVYFIRTLRQAVNTNILDLLLWGGLFVCFGVAAFVLAAVGLYGVTAFLASQRTREVGVRMALGARSGDVLSLVLKQGSRQVAFGVGLGLLLAAALRQALRGIGAEVVPWDPGVTLAICVGLAVISLVAVTVPAMRAMGVDPVDALRAE